MADDVEKVRARLERALAEASAEGALAAIAVSLVDAAATTTAKELAAHFAKALEKTSFGEDLRKKLVAECEHRVRAHLLSAVKDGAASHAAVIATAVVDRGDSTVH